MSDMKCPFCQQELKHEKITGIYCCPTIFVDCPLGSGTGAFGTKELWQELIRTKKQLVSKCNQLKIAVNALKSAKTRLELINNSKFANLNNVLQIQSQCEVLKINEALEQITALEQKDVK